MDGQVPARTPLGEGSFTIFALTAPFVKIRLVNTAAAGTQDMVGKDEFVFCLAGFEGLLEPLVLGVAYGDVPPIAVFLVFVTTAAAALIA